MRSGSEGYQLRVHRSILHFPYAWEEAGWEQEPDMEGEPLGDAAAASVTVPWLNVLKPGAGTPMLDGGGA